jgi:hypothetical protein
MALPSVVTTAIRGHDDHGYVALGGRHEGNESPPGRQRRATRWRHLLSVGPPLGWLAT